MCDKEFVFYEGEKRELTATIRSVKGDETVVITSAKYEVTKYYDEDEVVSQGACEIEGNEVIVFLEFLQQGSYQVKITVTVGREEIIKKIGVKVR